MATRKKATRKKAVRKKAVKKTRKKAVKKIIQKPKIKRVKRKKTLTKKDGIPMARKKRSSSRGKTGTVKKVSRKRSGTKKRNMKDVLMIAGLGIVGSIGAGLVAGKLTFIPDARIRAALPLAGGLYVLTSKMGNNKNLAALATGIMIAGGIGLVKQFKPDLVQIAGEDYEEYPQLVDYSGEEVDFSGVEDFGEDSDFSGVEDFGEDEDEEDEIYQGEEEDVFAYYS